VSLLIPEANKTKNFLLREYADKISGITNQMKEKMANCIEEMEGTRKEMFRVAKLMLKLKESMNKPR
jgi:methyl-accepting chemotaxis protein